MTGDRLGIITWGGIGDVILLTPALKALKAGREKLVLKVLCISPRHEEVLRNNPHIDILKIGRFASAPVEMLKVYLSRLARKPLGYFRPYYGSLFPSLFYDVPASRIIAEMLGIVLPSDAQPEIYLTPQEEEKVHSLLNGVSHPIVLHAHGAWSTNKEWPPESWTDLVRRNTDLTFCQVGAASDAKVAGCLDLRGKSLRETFAAIKLATAFVGIDSGFAHACAAFRTPAVVLFGPSTPVIWGHAANVNIWHPPQCSPCIDFLANDPCPYGKRCMSATSVEEVEHAIRAALRRER